MSSKSSPESALRGPIILSIVAAFVTIALKTVSYAVTGSAGLLSDALESGVNLLAAVMAALAIWYAAKPADDDHAYGHEKIEYFSSGFEGALIAVAGVSTIIYSIARLIRPLPLEQLDLGVGIAIIAAIVNAVVGLLLLRVGHRHRSIILTANGHHLMTDVLTSIGVVVALMFVRITGFECLDPLVAMAIGLNILWTGFRLIRTAYDGLMDRALPDSDQQRLHDAFHGALPEGAQYHALRTRQSGRRIFAEIHLMLPGTTSLHDAHAAGHRMEDAARAVLPDLELTVHHEPIEDQASWEPGRNDAR